MYRTVKQSWAKFWAGLALLSVDVILILVLFLASLIAFIWSAKYVFLDDKTAFDDAAFIFLESWVSEINTGIMNFFTLLGTYQFLIPAHLLLTLWFLFVKRHRWYSIKIPVIGASSALIMLFLKSLFDRQRPLIPLLEPVGGLSFPSGHAMCSVTFFGLFIYFIWKRKNINRNLKYMLTALLVFVIFMIGLSRVYLRVHHASDVLAGFAFGIIWLVLSLKALDFMEQKTKKRMAPVIGLGEAPTVEAKMGPATPLEEDEPEETKANP